MNDTQAFHTDPSPHLSTYNVFHDHGVPSNTTARFGTASSFGSSSGLSNTRSYNATITSALSGVADRQHMASTYGTLTYMQGSQSKASWFKAYTTEHRDEYREPKAHNATLKALTLTYGTTKRTKKPSTLPNYETRVLAF